FRVGCAAIGSELLRRDKAVNGRMFSGRLQILADGEEVYIGGTKVIHQRGDLITSLAQTEHDARLGEEYGVELLGTHEQRKRMSVVGAGSDAPVESGHGLDIVVEH